MDKAQLTDDERAEIAARHIAKGSYRLRKQDNYKDILVRVYLKTSKQKTIYGILKLRERDIDFARLILKYLKSEIKSCDFVELKLMDDVDSLYTESIYIPNNIRQSDSFEVSFVMVAEKDYPKEDIGEILKQQMILHKETKRMRK